MSEVAVSLLSRLGDFVAAGRILTDPVSLVAYDVDGRRPSAALLPASVTELAEILRFASTERLAAIPVGGKTHLHIGMPPHPYDLALDLSGMNRLLEYEPQDLTLGAEPGVTFAELTGHLRENGQFLPLASSFPDRATLGGIVAVNADTPFRYTHGTARDFLLGAEFVTGEGVVSKSGGRVVKNVTGYDLHKLLIGSLGTLAVMTRLNFRTFPLPPGQKMFVAAFGEAAGAFAFCRKIASSALQPRIVDVLDPGTAELFSAAASLLLPEDCWLAVIEAAGHNTVLERHARDLSAMSREAGAGEFVALDEAQRDRLFHCLRDFSAMAFSANSTATVFRIASVPTAIPALIGEAHSAAQVHALHCAILIRALGVVYLALLPPDRATAFPELLSCSRGLMELCLNSGAAPMIERCPREIKNTLSVWPPAGNEGEIAQRLKRVFDPQTILSPGRFRGSI